MQIFAKVRYLCKHLQKVMTLERDLWDMIAIIIALDSLYKNFNTTTVSLLEKGNKTIDQIQSILQSKETMNINKQASIFNIMQNNRFIKIAILDNLYYYIFLALANILNLTILAYYYQY